MQDGCNHQKAAKPCGGGLGDQVRRECRKEPLTRCTNSREGGHRSPGMSLLQGDRKDSFNAELQECEAAEVEFRNAEN
jgi:hypothetical protein